MFCKKCGNEIPDGAAVCPNCSAPVSSQPAPQTNAGPYAPPQAQPYPAAAAPKKK